MEVEDLGVAPGKSVLLSQGIPGLKANVYRIKDGSKDEEKELLYSNEYQPKETVVQVAPKRRYSNPNIK